MKNLTLEINEFKLSADVVESWNEMTAEQINHVLMVFDAPVALMGEESIDWRLLQIFKALTKWTDDDLRVWELLSLEAYGHDSIFFSDLKILMDAATSFLILKDDDGYSINPELTLNAAVAAVVPSYTFDATVELATVNVKGLTVLLALT
jgi:hypothetical protein